MLIEIGENLHIMYRSLYDKSNRRHFIGKVCAAKDAVCRVEGYFFVYDEKRTEFVRKEDKRTTIVDSSDSGFVTNIIAADVNLEDVRYRYTQDAGLVATDGKSFSLNINEFGARS